MKQILFFLLIGLVTPNMLFAQRVPAQALRTAIKGRNVVLTKDLKPLSNTSIEALVSRGKSKLVLQRALGVAWQRQDPVSSVLKDGEIHRALLRHWWRQASIYKYRWEEKNTLGLNSWLIVLGHRIREGMKFNSSNLQILEEQLLLAQADAEREFKQRYQYIPLPRNYENTPDYLSLLSESVAHRLDTYFLPLLATADRVRLLQVLMHGMFSGPVDWTELHTAVLFREIRECLHARARKMKQVELYGKMKDLLRQTARKTAQEAAHNSISSMLKLREMYIEDLQEATSIFADDKKGKKDWEMLIDFFQTKQRYTPSNS